MLEYIAAVLDKVVVPGLKWLERVVHVYGAFTIYGIYTSEEALSPGVKIINGVEYRDTSKISLSLLLTGGTWAFTVAGLRKLSRRCQKFVRKNKPKKVRNDIDAAINSDGIVYARDLVRIAQSSTANMAAGSQSMEPVVLDPRRSVIVVLSEPTTAPLEESLPAALREPVQPLAHCPPPKLLRRHAVVRAAQ